MVIRRRGKARVQDGFFKKFESLYLLLPLMLFFILRWKWFCKEWKVIPGVYISQKAVRIVLFLSLCFGRREKKE